MEGDEGSKGVLEGDEGRWFVGKVDCGMMVGCWD